MYKMVRKYAIVFFFTKLYAIYTFLENININTMLLMAVVTIVIIIFFMRTHINNKIINSAF